VVSQAWCQSWRKDPLYKAVHYHITRHALYYYSTCGKLLQKSNERCDSTTQLHSKPMRLDVLVTSISGSVSSKPRRVMHQISSCYNISSLLRLSMFHCHKLKTTRPRGRPTKRWTINVEEAIEVSGSTLIEVKCSALDRQKWRSLISHWQATGLPVPWYKYKVRKPYLHQTG